MRLRPGVAVTAAVTLCAALAGCGDSGGSSSGATEITVWEGWVGVDARERCHWLAGRGRRF